MKIYEVTFNQYANNLYDTVTDGVELAGQTKYLRVGRDPFLITEDQIEEIKKYGKGIKTLKFMGNLWDT